MKDKKLNSLEIGDVIYPLLRGSYIKDRMVVDHVTERTALAGGIRFKRFYRSDILEPMANVNRRELEITVYKIENEKLKARYEKLHEKDNE